MTVRYHAEADTLVDKKDGWVRARDSTVARLADVIATELSDEDRVELAVEAERRAIPRRRRPYSWSFDEVYRRKFPWTWMELTACAAWVLGRTEREPF